MKFKQAVAALYGDDVPTAPRHKPHLNPEGSLDVIETDSTVLEADDTLENEDDLEVENTKDLDVLREVSSKVETLVDKVMTINTDREYSKLLKILQSAVRLADELIESDSLLK